MADARPGGWGGLQAAVSFLTPFANAREPAPDALRWFPIVGAAIGATVGTAWWAAGKAWPPAVAAAVAVIVDLAVTGLLHFDGLCDAADGLLPPLDRGRRLEVMAKPDVGAFGVVAAGAALITRWAALAALRPSPALLAALWCASRTWMAATVGVVPYARPSGGLASAFMAERSHGWAIASGGGVAALVLAAIWRPAIGPVAIGTGTLAAVWVIWFAVRRLGGFTGDVLGAVGVVGETVGLLVAAGRW